VCSSDLVAFVVFFFFVVVIFFTAVLFVFFFVWLFSKEDIGSDRAIGNFWVEGFWTYSAHAQWYASQGCTFTTQRLSFFLLSARCRHTHANRLGSCN
jgi:hypothetical protein